MAAINLAEPAANLEEAIRLGTLTYFAAKPCGRKHQPTIRYTAGRQCVACATLTHTQWRQQNADLKKAIDKAYYRIPENKKKNIESTLARRAENPEARRETDRAAYARDPLPFNNRITRWLENNPRASCIRQSRRRSRQRSAPGNHTELDMIAILAMQGGRCAYFKDCGVDLTRATCADDHIIPLARGGSNDRQNMQCCCRSHNASKGDKDPIIWVRVKLGWLI